QLPAGEEDRDASDVAKPDHQNRWMGAALHFPAVSRLRPSAAKQTCRVSSQLRPRRPAAPATELTGCTYHTPPRGSAGTRPTTGGVTLQFKGVALSDLCDHLRDDTGIELSAGPSVADEKVTVSPPHMS